MNFIIITRKTLSVMLLFLLFIGTCESFARAGGGGSGSGSSSSSSSSDGSDDNEESPIKVAYYIVGFIIAGVVLAKNYKDDPNNYFNTIDADADGEMLLKTKGKGLDKFERDNPNFNQDAFLLKVRTAFVAIQYAWSKKDLTEVRRYISDGVWQRFHTQLIIMDKLKQTNRIENVTIHKCQIDAVEADGQYDTIHVGILASQDDFFEYELNESLNTSESNKFIEYWSFIRRKSTNSKDLYNSKACPSCGVEITDSLGEVAKCPYCAVLLNSGEYDWVLAEITQARDYIFGDITRTKNLSIKREQLVQEYEDFSVQGIEDYASNGYLQYLTAKVFNTPERVARFFTNELLESKINEIKHGEYQYNRLFLNDVTLIAAERVDNYNRLYINITESYLRGILFDNKLYNSTMDICLNRQIVRLIRKVNSGKKKGSLYVHQCSSCGAQVADSLDTKCHYCGSILNSGDNEWVFDAILSPMTYGTYIEENSSTFEFAVKVSELDSIMTTKEYAINNIMCIIAADGKMTEKELQYLEEFATKMKFSKKAKKGIIATAKENRLSLSFPDDQQAKEKIYELMVEAANADGIIQLEEQKILEHIKKIVFSDELNVEL